MRSRDSSSHHERRRPLEPWQAGLGSLVVILFVSVCATVPTGTPELCRETTDQVWLEYDEILIMQDQSQMPVTPVLHQRISGWDQDCAALKAWIEKQ